MNDLLKAAQAQCLLMIAMVLLLILIVAELNTIKHTAKSMTVEQVALSLAYNPDSGRAKQLIIWREIEPIEGMPDNDGQEFNKIDAHTAKQIEKFFQGITKNKTESQ